MRIAGLQLDRSVAVRAICCGACAIVFAATAGTNIAEATVDPVTQTTPAENTDSTTAQVDVDSSSTQLESKSTRRSDAKSKEARNADVHRSRRLVVLDFLEQHFPELRQSLIESERKAPRRSRNAIKRIERDIIQLEGIKRRHAEKFELAVQQWKLKTQIEITIAKYAKRESDSQLEQRLKPLIEEMMVIRKSILEIDRQTVADRLGKIDKQLSNLETSPERAVEFRLRLFQKSIDEIRSKQKTRSMNLGNKSSSDRARSEVKP